MPAAHDDRRILDGALADLADLITPDPDAQDQRARRHRLVAEVAELRRRFADDRLRIAVIGESKRGKSIFTNALIGRPVLPMGVTPLTSVATTVTYGQPEEVRVTLRDGTAQQHSLAALPDLVTEESNPGNRLGLTGVTVRLAAPLLTEGIELVDTPGTGSVHEANTVEAEIAYRSMDVAVFVLSADPPISAAERALLRQVLPSSVTTFVVLNKADRLTADELTQALAFTRGVVAEAAGREMTIYPCSARDALDVALGTASTARGGPSPVRDGEAAVRGIDAFLRDFSAYLRTGRSTALLTSLRRHTAGIIAQLLDEVTLTVRAAQLRQGADSSRVELFRDQLHRARRHQEDADDKVQGESQRLLAELNDDAARMATEAAEVAVRAVAHHLAGADAVSTADLEDEAQRVGADATTAAVESWRSERAGILQDRLDALDERLRQDLDRDLEELRPAARALLGVDLAARPTDSALAPPRRFYYQFGTDLDAVGMLSAGIRHRLPGRWSRARAGRYVLRQADMLARQQVGRARADLQERLAATTRALRSALTVRYADHHARMLEALDAATEVHSRSAGDAAARRAGLDQRRSTLVRLLGVVEEGGAAVREAERSGQPVGQ